MDEKWIEIKPGCWKKSKGGFISQVGMYCKTNNLTKITYSGKLA